MATEIRKWVDIADGFKDTLVLGNGASIAIDTGFSYGSLLKKAQEDGLITEAIECLFGEMKSADFELILRYVAIAEFVNRALEIHDGKTRKTYQDVRNALIQTVRKIHPEHKDIGCHLQPAYEFMRQFKTVVSLNYDLLTYWAILEGNDALGNQFKDCFTQPNRHFNHDWESLRKPHKADEATLVFYPHGNLALAIDSEFAEFKIASTKSASLLKQIVKTWENKLSTPLFVAEGSSEQKLAAIRRSVNLSTVYENVLPSLTETVAIYGWSFDKKDKHLLERICKGKSKIAISVHGNNETNGGSESWCGSVSRKIHNINSGAEIQFYSAESPDCWIHPS